MLGDDDDLFLSFFNKLVPNMMMIDFGWVFLILSTNTYTFHTYSLSLSFLHFSSLPWGNGIHLLLPTGESNLFLSFFAMHIRDYKYRSQIHTYIRSSLSFFKPLLKWLFHMT